MIRKKGQRYEVRSKDGKKKLGSYRTRAEANARLRQIEHFQKRSKVRYAIPEDGE